MIAPGLAFKTVVLAYWLLGLAGCSNARVDFAEVAARGPAHYAEVQGPPPEVVSQLPSPPSTASADDASVDRGRPSDDDEPSKDVFESLPPPENVQSTSALALAEVLESVDVHFPLLLAVAEERAIAAANRVSAEGGFDLDLSARGSTQDGTFSNDRLDFLAKQATPYHGLSVLGGYRFGLGDFPVYYGDRQTADGGEFRAGVALPLLRDGAIDKRRAALRQALIGESLADPVVRRARLEYLRSAARAYWNWVAAGAQYGVADSLLRLARDRQAGFEEQFERGQIAEFVVIDNRRLIAEREGTLVVAERRFQQASFDLSLYLRDSLGNPVVPRATRLPSDFAQWQPSRPATDRLAENTALAIAQRPELVRFALLKERVAVDLRLAQNQTLPAVTAGVYGSQDVGQGKDGSGIFAADRSAIEGSLLLEVPLQRREATGRVRAAQAALSQLTAQERYARDQIVVEVQDAVSNMDRTFERLSRAREELSIAQRVAEMEMDRFRKGQGNLLDVNLRELTAAAAQAKVIDALADYFRALADFQAAIGQPPAPR